ncbi:MAG TPA: amidase [Casimicrobiaceae bacterium]
MSDWHRLDASTAAALIRRGELTSEALVAACVERIAARERDVGAWQFLASEQALEHARKADRSAALGPLHGVPIAVKDLVDTFDMPTALGSPLYTDRRPSWDAACVAAARAAGAIVLGKTVTTEFASFHPGKTRNPHDRTRTPGGSSSGSAAAVADFMVPLAFGTQTAASVTRPAAFCGIVGYKATFGELSLSGVRPLAPSLDTLGIFARSVADVVLMRNVVLGQPRSAPTSRAAAPRFGVCRTSLWPLAQPAARDALERAIARLRAAGASVEEVELPASFDALIDAQQTIMTFETARNYVFEMTHHADALSASFRATCSEGEKIPYEAWLAALRCVENARARLPEVLRRCDVLVTPAAPGEAPPIEGGTGDPLMSRMWTALGVPTLALPVPRAAGALPVAVQLVAGLHDDAMLLKIGDWSMRAFAAT